MPASESAADAVVMPAVSLGRREVVRFLRQRSRVIGALGTPLVFWLLLGSGMRDSFRAQGTGDQNYLQYSYPGILALIVLFTSIFSMISVIEDRREGFLQAVLTSPASRLGIVLGKILGSTVLALLQAALFLLLAPIVGVQLTTVSVLASIGILILIAVGLGALGFLLAWSMDSTQGFHAIMNLFLMPMWLLSGAFFPASGASRWLRLVMDLNPLTYGVAALRRALSATPSAVGDRVPTMSVSLAVTVGACVVLVALATRAATGSRKQT